MNLSEGEFHRHKEQSRPNIISSLRDRLKLADQPDGPEPTTRRFSFTHRRGAFGRPVLYLILAGATSLIPFGIESLGSSTSRSEYKGTENREEQDPNPSQLPDAQELEDIAQIHSTQSAPLSPTVPISNGGLFP